MKFTDKLKSVESVNFVFFIKQVKINFTFIKQKIHLKPNYQLLSKLEMKARLSG